MKALTTESLFQGRVKIRQKKEGYRFSTDAVILAHLIPLRDGDLAVDLGTGCGIIPIVLAYRFPCARFVGIELQEDLACLAEANVRLNAMDDRVSIVHGDIRDIASYIVPGTANVVFSNPPYRREKEGRVSPNTEKAFARHELGTSLSDVLSAARRALKASGAMSIIYPAVRSMDLVTQMRAFGLEPKRLRWVHSKIESPAELVYVKGVKEGNPGVQVVAPLYVHTADGRFTREMDEMMEG